MRNRAIAMVSALTLISGAYALPASASPPSTKPPGNRPPATTAHSSTVTVQCNGSGSFTDNFVTDANAAFGQQMLDDPQKCLQRRGVGIDEADAPEVEVYCARQVSAGVLFRRP